MKKLSIKLLAALMAMVLLATNFTLTSQAAVAEFVRVETNYGNARSRLIYTTKIVNGKYVFDSCKMSKASTYSLSKGYKASTSESVRKSDNSAVASVTLSLTRKSPFDFRYDYTIGIYRLDPDTGEVTLD